ncbi:unnamed protein product [Allacma fusca]|uniref:Uncharacterized protein n=1 Tax=Allacma fusca TaxID=39272 RepID=A0A8J2MC95_9HEXA|nr:unnamed protein product [Allacma fusca]
MGYINWVTGWKGWSKTGGTGQELRNGKRAREGAKGEEVKGEEVKGKRAKGKGAKGKGAKGKGAGGLGETEGELGVCLVVYE